MAKYLYIVFLVSIIYSSSQRINKIELAHNALLSPYFRGKYYDVCL